MTAIVRNRSLDVVRRTREEPDVDDALAANLVDESAAPAREVEERAQAHSIQRVPRSTSTPTSARRSRSPSSTGSPTRNSRATWAGRWAP